MLSLNSVLCHQGCGDRRTFVMLSANSFEGGLSASCEFDQGIITRKRTPIIQAACSSIDPAQLRMASSIGETKILSSAILVVFVLLMMAATAASTRLSGSTS